MIATIALDAAGNWHYASDPEQRDKQGRPVAPRERDGRGRFVAAAEVVEAVVAYIAREALKAARERAEALARTFAEFLAMALPAPKPGHAKAERIRATAPGPPRGLTKREADHQRRGQLWTLPLQQAAAMAREHRERFMKGA